MDELTALRAKHAKHMAWLDIVLIVGAIKLAVFLTYAIYSYP